MAEPRSISNIVKDVTKHTFSSKDMLFGKMVAEWVHIVGEDMAGQAVPLELKYNKNPQQRSQAVLHLGVKPAHALEFSYQKALLIERLNMFFGYSAIRDIKIIQYSGVMPHQRPAARVARALSGSETVQMDKKLEKIEERELQIALRNLGKAILLNERGRV